jgi:hypothetical protein
MNRREFLGVTIVSGIGLFAGGGIGLSYDPALETPARMQSTQV